MEPGPRSKHTGIHPKVVTSPPKSTPTKTGISGKKIKKTESQKRPVKTVQIIRKVEYSSSLQETEEPPISTEGGAADGEAKKKCIVLIVKKNKDDNNNIDDTPNRNIVAPPTPPCKRSRMSMEPLPKPAGKGRYVKVRKEALQSLPELRELINFHRSKHVELIQENQLYDSSLGENLSLPISPNVPLPPKRGSLGTPRRDAVRTYRRPPATLPEGPGYLFALNTQGLRAPELWPPPLTPSTHHAPRSPLIRDVKENIPVRRPRDEPRGILHQGEDSPAAYPRLPVVEILPPSLLDYENVTILDEDPGEDFPQEMKADSRAKKVLEDFDFLNSWEPFCDPDESGYVPNCPDFDFKSLEIDRAPIEIAESVPESQDPLLEELCRVVWRETFDPFQQPVRPSPSSSVRGSKGSEVTSKPEKSSMSASAVLRWKCKLCGEKHATKNSLITHLKLHQQPFCPICLAVTSSPKKLRTHTLKAHPADARQELLSVDGVIVTSKYGRRRAVLDAATLCGRKRLKPRNSV